MASVFLFVVPATGQIFFSKNAHPAFTDAASVLAPRGLIALHVCLDFGQTQPRKLARAAI